MVDWIWDCTRTQTGPCATPASWSADCQLGPGLFGGYNWPWFSPLWQIISWLWDCTGDWLGIEPVWSVPANDKLIIRWLPGPQCSWLEPWYSPDSADHWPAGHWPALRTALELVWAQYSSDPTDNWLIVRHPAFNCPVEGKPGIMIQDSPCSGK